MRWLYLALLLLILLELADAAKKPSKGKKPAKKPAKKPGKKPSKPKCLADSINKAKFAKYTMTTGKGKSMKPVLGEVAFSSSPTSLTVCLLSPLLEGYHDSD